MYKCPHRAITEDKYSKRKTEEQRMITQSISILSNMVLICFSHKIKITKRKFGVREIVAITVPGHMVQEPFQMASEKSLERFRDVN